MEKADICKTKWSEIMFNFTNNRSTDLGFEISMLDMENISLYDKDWIHRQTQLIYKLYTQLWLSVTLITN